MAQHYLLSAAACNFDREEIDCLDEEGAIRYLARLRWGEDVQQCPSCDLPARHIWRKKRRHWRCRACSREFSVLVGTVFQDSKISAKKLLKAIFRFTATANGISAIEMRFELNVGHKAAWTLQGKLREVLVRTSNPCQLSGLIHIDGAYFGGKPRSVNNHGITSPEGVAAAVKQKYGGAPTQRARRYRAYKPGGKANQERKDKNRRLVYGMRQVGPNRGDGAIRTSVAVVHRDTEIERDANQLVQRFVAVGASIMTDESYAYRRFNDLGYFHAAVMHKKQWSTPNGVNNNQAESLFSRMRRAEYGVFHRYEPTYLKDYAIEMAWREDTRRQPLRQRFEGLIHRIFLAGRSQWFRGYYQENCYLKGQAHPYVRGHRRRELLDL